MRVVGPWSRSLTLLLALSFVCASGGAMAQPHQVICSDALPESNAAPEFWERAVEIREYCQRDTGYLVAVARWLNGQRRYQDAQLYAERALMVSADYVPAWIEFAISQAGLGNLTLGVDALRQAKEFAAEQILASRALQAGDHVESSRLSGWVTEIDSLLNSLVRRQGPANSGMVDLFLAYTDNFLGAPSSTDFELTFPSGPVTVRAPESLARKKGFFSGLGWVKKGHLFERTPYLVNATAKKLLKNDSEALISLEARLEHQNVANSGYYLIGSGSAFAEGSGLTMLILNGQFGSEIDGPFDCTLRLGGEFEARRYPQSESLDGNFFGALHEGVCPSGWRWRISLGADSPVSNRLRTGGMQSQRALEISKTTNFGSKKLLISLNLVNKIDQEGYSTLLSNNAIRKANMWTLAVDYQWGSWGVVEPYIHLTNKVQSSNIELFRVRNTVLHFGVKKKL